MFLGVFLTYYIYNMEKLAKNNAIFRKNEQEGPSSLETDEC